jgi:hypothetical protein
MVYTRMREFFNEVKNVSSATEGIFSSAACLKFLGSWVIRSYVSKQLGLGHLSKLDDIDVKMYALLL